MAASPWAKRLKILGNADVACATFAIATWSNITCPGGSAINSGCSARQVAAARATRFTTKLPVLVASTNTTAAARPD